MEIFNKHLSCPRHLICNMLITYILPTFKQWVRFDSVIIEYFVFYLFSRHMGVCLTRGNIIV